MRELAYAVKRTCHENDYESKNLIDAEVEELEKELARFRNIANIIERGVAPLEMKTEEAKAELRYFKQKLFECFSFQGAGTIQEDIDSCKIDVEKLISIFKQDAHEWIYEY